MLLVSDLNLAVHFYLIMLLAGSLKDNLVWCQPSLMFWSFQPYTSPNLYTFLFFLLKIKCGRKTTMTTRIRTTRNNNNNKNLKKEPEKQRGKEEYRHWERPTHWQTKKSHKSTKSETIVLKQKDKKRKKKEKKTSKNTFEFILCWPHVRHGAYAYILCISRETLLEKTNVFH